MKVCVFGAGAIGGHIAAQLIAAGRVETSVVARGAHLAAMRADGLSLHYKGEERRVRPAAASDAPGTLPPQDLVIVTLKAQALPAAGTAIRALLAPEGAALFVVNGIPWWWHHGLPGPRRPLPLLDPQGKLWELLRDKAIGAICLWSSEVMRPGSIRTTRDGALVLGEPDGSASGRLARTAGILREAGIEVRESADLRGDIWEKLLVNAALNPVSALTRRTTFDITRDPALNAMLAAVMREVVTVAGASGWPLAPDIDALLDPARRPRDHRTSMLQDVLAGRSLETEALLGQLVEFAHAANVAVPHCGLLLALLRRLDTAAAVPPAG